MDNEELINVMRRMFREESVSLRAIVREETNAAIYASEQRLGERLDRLEKEVKELRADVTQLKAEFGEMKMTMDMYSHVTNETRTSQFAVEGIVAEHLRSATAFYHGGLDAAKRFSGAMSDHVSSIKEINERLARVAEETREAGGRVKSFAEKMREADAQHIRAMNEINAQLSRVMAELRAHMNKPLHQAHPDSDGTAA